MNYLLDKKIRQKRFLKLALLVLFLIILIFFQTGIFRGFSTISHFVFRPVLILGNNIGDKLGNIEAFFSSKKSLSLENEQLKSEIDSNSAKLSNYNSLLDENNQLKEILGRRANITPMVLAGILSKPNQSPYDTLLVDVGNNEGIKTGNTVFAFGNIPIGDIDTVYGSSAKVVLFSSPGEKTEVVVMGKPAQPDDSGHSGGNIFVEAVGRGGGNFEILLPRDISLDKGTEITLPGINSYVLGIVEAVISDPRDSFQKILLTAPVNIQKLKFVGIEIQK